jgi:tape measure domain-containing protein
MAEKVEYILSLKDLFTPKMQSAISETDKLDNAMGKVNRSTNTTSNSLLSFGNIVKGAALAGLGMLSKGVFDSAVQLEALTNQLGYASGSMQKGSQDLQYVRRTANEMGLELNAAQSGFVGLSASLKGTSLAGQGVKDIFEGMSMASTVNHMTTEQQSQAFKALTDMAGKGVVSMEELRGQLGDAGLKGAFKIAADSMNMTTEDFNKFVSQGKLASDVFLPRFAAQLKKEFAGGMDMASNSLQANVNRMSNSWTLIKQTLGSGLGGVFASGMEGVQRVFGAINQGIEYLKGNIVALQGIFQPLIDVLVYTWETIKGVFTSFNLGEMFNTWANALGAVFYVLKPFAIVLIDTLGFALKVVIGLVNGVAELVLGIGKLFGYQEKKLGIKLDDKDVLGQSKAMQTAMGTNAPTSVLGSPKATNAGLESRATQVSGSKPTSIVINVGKLVETQNFNGSIDNIKNLAPNVRDEMIKIFLSMLNDSQQLAAV